MCRKPFSLTSVSWLKGTKLDLKDIWLLLDCWQQKAALKTTSRVLGLSMPTVRRWFRRFQENLVYESPELRGIVEMDEAFVGRRRHGNQRIVLGAYERTSGKVVLSVERNREQETTDRFLLNHVDRSSAVCTDSAMCYEGIDAFFGYAHVACDHGVFEFGPTNHIECVWSALKRLIRRTWHHVHAKWLPLLVREFEARWNSAYLFISPSIYLHQCLVAVPTR